MWVSRFFFFIYTFFSPRKSIKECECRVGKSGLKSRSPGLQLGEGGTVPHSDEACFTILINEAHFPYKVVNRAAEEASAEAQVPQNHCQIFVWFFFLKLRSEWKVSQYHFVPR